MDDSSSYGTARIVRLSGTGQIDAITQHHPTIYGPGLQTRSSCYVDDLITGILALMAKPPDFTGSINLGNPGEFSIAELAERVIALTGSKSRIEYKPLPKDDPARRQPDISLARRQWDWEPKTQLDDGLRKTIIYFDELLTH